MTLSKFLSNVAAGHGADALEGGMVFLMLDREVDKLISRALALGPFHRGKPSPWSHCFLLAEPYHGPDTKILDCTIRGADGKVEWHTSIKESLAILAEGTVGKGAGKIYDGAVADYDDDHVIARGIRWLPGLAPKERRAIVEYGRSLQAANVRYDLPGLVRELIHLLVGIHLPPSSKRLFCSAFLQAAYRHALGNVGDFAPNVRDEDTTPDDIWYSHKGLGIANTPSSTAAQAHHGPHVHRRFGRTGEAASSQAAGVEGLASLVAGDTTRESIENALAKLDASGATSALEGGDAVRATLKNALAQLDRAAKEGKLGQSDAPMHSDEMDLSLVKSALAEPDAPTATAALFGRDIEGTEQFENLDLRWLESVWHRITSKKVPFAVAKQTKDVVYPIPDATTIAIAGDWGTGNASSKRIADEIAKLKPDYTIHLGDVYYSGTESEERSRMVSLWPAGTRGSLTLNSNHEMYSGGRGYFGVALSSEKFRMQKGYSYFALTNGGWLVIGLDSAYGASGMYQNGNVNDAQLRWLKGLMESDVARSGGAPKNVIVLTHHQPMELGGERTGLFNQVKDALGRAPNRWYWGHVHGVAAFKPVVVDGISFKGRLVGHGGVPFALDEKTEAVEWLEDQTAGDPEIPKRAKNGFAFLELGKDSVESFRDEFGQVRWKRS